jgi:8-oxo-dGTP diphosphatase
MIESGKILILKNNMSDGGKQAQWELPGGLLELNESRDAELRREVKEETGLNVSIGSIVAVWDFWEHAFKFRDGRVLEVRIIAIAYRCTRTGGQIQLSNEHTQYQWVTDTELHQLDFALNSRFAIEAYKM